MAYTYPIRPIAILGLAGIACFYTQTRGAICAAVLKKGERYNDL